MQYAASGLKGFTVEFEVCGEVVSMVDAVHALDDMSGCVTVTVTRPNGQERFFQIVPLDAGGYSIDDIDNRLTVVTSIPDPSDAVQIAAMYASSQIIQKRSKLSRALLHSERI